MGRAVVRSGSAWMIQPRPARRLVLVLLIAVGGCGEHVEGQERPAPPTRAELSRFVAETRQPAYWLGAGFRGITVSHASAGGGRVSVTYGPWTCDSGCTDAGGIWTRRRSIDDLWRDSGNRVLAPKKCWTRVKKAVAVLIGCDPDGYPQELLVFSGTYEILVTSLYTPDGAGEIPARTVVRALRPLNALAPWPLSRPAPLTCHEFSRVDRGYRRHMPPPLRPRGEC